MPLGAILGGIASAASAWNSASSGSSGGTPRYQRLAQREIVNASKNMKVQNAGFTPDQIAAQEGVRAMQGKYAPQYAEAMDNARGLANGVTPDDIRSFYNPYESDVVSAFLNDLGVMRQQETMRANDAASRASAFGGDRHGVYEGVLQGQMDRTGALTLADIRKSGYDMAGNLAMQNQALRTAGNAQYGNMIDSARGADYGDINALNVIGQQQQDLNQRRLNEPLDTLRFRSEINNPGTSYSNPTQVGPNQDKLGMALEGFQGGYNAVNDALSWWEKMRKGSTAPVDAASKGR